MRIFVRKFNMILFVEHATAKLPKKTKRLDSMDIYNSLHHLPFPLPPLPPPPINQSTTIERSSSVEWGFLGGNVVRYNYRNIERFLLESVARIVPFFIWSNIA